MKKFFFLLLTVLMGMGSLTLSAQNTLTVADGTATSSYVPVYGLYVDNFVRCQTIYPAIMIDSAATTIGMNGATITSLSYDLSTPATDSWNGAQFVVKFKEVPVTTLSSFVDMTDATTVYTGPLDATQATMDITLTTPYTYHGGNLLIEFYNTQSGTYKSASFYGVAASGASLQGYHSSAWSSVSGTVRDFIPKTTFTFTGGAPVTCRPVHNLAINEALTTESSMTLTWTDNINTGATYTVYNLADTTVIQSGITTDSFTVTGLEPNTEYAFSVEANCSASDASIRVAIVGRTACAPLTTLPFTESFEILPDISNPLPFCWERYVSAHTNSIPYPYSYPSTTYAHTGSRVLYFYGTNGATYSDTMIAILPAIDVNSYAMDGTRLTFWARMSSASASKKVYVITMTDPADPATIAVIDSVVVTGNTYTLNAVPLTSASPVAPYAALMVKKGSGTMYIDDVTLEVLPSCLEVGNLTAVDITPSTVTLQWTDAANTDVAYSIYIADSLVGTTFNTTYMITDLEANTQYTFSVVANCTMGDANATTINVRTACDAYGLPFTENFSASVSNDPCWRGASMLVSSVFAGTPLPLSNINGWSYQSTANNGLEPGHYRVNIYGTVCNYWLITPAIDLSQSSSPLLSFDAAFTNFNGIELASGDISDDKFMVIISTDGGETWDSTNAISYSLSSLNSLTYLTQYVDLSNYSGDTIKIAFYGESTIEGGDNNLHLDNISIVETTGDLCLPVTGLNVNNVTENTATLNWIGSADSYNVYVLSGNDTTLVENVTATSYGLSGLTAMTNYTYAVRAVCGNDSSDLVTVTFATACSAVMLPYTETFEPSSGAASCWSSVGSGLWSIGTGDYSTTTGSYEGTHNALITHNTTGNVTKLVSPVLAGVDNGLALSFAYVIRSWAGDIDALRIYVRADADSAWQQVAEYTNATEVWTVGSVVIPGTVYQVAFEHTDNYGYGVGLDSVVFAPMPNCLPVSNLTVSETTANTVTISWTGDAASYDVYNGYAFVTNVTTNSYTFTGLTSSTGYTFGVQAICSSTDSAALVTIEAITSCDAITTYPYVQDFASAPECWATLDADGDGQAWILYEGTIQSASYNSVALFPDNWLISPQFEIPVTGNYEVTWTATAQDQSWPAEHYGVYISTTGYADTANYTLLQEWTLGTGIFNPVIDLSNYAGESIYIALRHFNCTDQFRLSIDDFTVREQAGANQVTINVGQNNPAYGTVTGGGIYDIGDNVTVTATPATGYAFSKWVDEAGNVLSTSNPYTFVAVTDLTLSAVFLDNSGTTYVITVEVNDPAMGTATGGGTYTAGDQATLVATPYAGYGFVNWTQVSSFGTNVVGTDPSLTITVTGDKTFVANFEVDTTVVPEPCDVPTGLYVDTTATGDQTNVVRWDDNENVSQWNVQYKTAYTDWTTETVSTNYYQILNILYNELYSVRVQAVCDENTISDWTDTVNLMVLCGIDDYLQSRVSLYPNPAKEYVDIRVDGDLNVTAMEVYDVYGKLVNTVIVNDNPTRINVSGLADGMYFVRVTTEAGAVTKTFVKK